MIEYEISRNPSDFLEKKCDQRFKAQDVINVNKMFTDILGADKSLARQGRKQANFSVRMA